MAFLLSRCGAFRKDRQDDRLAGIESIFATTLTTAQPQTTIYLRLRIPQVIFICRQNVLSRNVIHSRDLT